MFERFRLHVIDLDPSSVTSGGWLEDTSLVDKYTISQEAYEKCDGNLLKLQIAFFFVTLFSTKFCMPFSVRVHIICVLF